MASSKKYIKKDPIEHIMLRPDMYIGSTTIKKSEEYIAEKVDGKYRIYKKEISVSPGIMRVFIEALSNAIDNVVRSKTTKTKCTKIKVDFDRETGLTSILNDGDVIPIELNEDNRCYNHSLIFGHLLTGSKYDDTEDRFTSGKNGLGVKLLNVFSSQFNVEGLDPQNGKILKQTWVNNMRSTEGPVITNTKIKKGYTKISWIPDFTLFKIEKYTDDIISLYTRYVIDSAMLTKINVYINEDLIPVSSLQTYASIYSSPSEESLAIKIPNSEVVLCTSDDDFQHISFVNGISTKLGGVHVDAWSEAIFRPIVDKFNGTKSKAPKININDVKQFFKLFVNSTVVRPEFDGQSKNKLESPTVEADIKKTQISAICKWSIMSKIEDIIRSKEFSVLKKSESKRKKIIKIDGLDHANLAGSKYANECTLIICEGLSAKTYAVAGIQKGVYGKAGRDWFGIYPLTGKLMNVRNFTPTSIASNKVITNLIQTIGLRYDTNYLDEANYNSLNYGKIMVMTDADVDGCHIEGLLINFFHYLFPSLLQREKPFLVSMKTPIVRVFIPKGEDILFYDEKRFQKWFSEQNKKVKTKYYKGLGTTRPEDVPDTFGLKMVEYIKDNDIDTNMSKVFSKKESDMRKEWLSDYSIENHIFSLDDQPEISHMELSSFINGELIKFSIADCGRSIPNFIDGLKESQRKILYAVKKRNLRYSGQSLKVAQLSGYTAEHSNYHHGEQNLCDTIIGLANEFPGTNNIPLLYRDGMFGTRLEGGSDAASPRYIYTKMEYLTEYIFREEDEALLTQVSDDGDLVQPEFYIPILPMILVNGCNAGIGTGWSCNIPCFNPIEIIDGIKDWLNNNTSEDTGERKENVSVLPTLIPWYRGFKGTIEADESKVKRYITKGIIEENKNGFEVSELPINMWTNKFKEFCEDLQEEKKLKTMKNYSTPNDVKFIITNGNEFECSIENLKLHSYLYTSNMVLFDDKNKIKKYDSVYEILNNFCVVRYKYYHLRKEYQLRQLGVELKMLQNKERFVSEVMDDTLDIMKKKEIVIIQNLKTRNYDEDLKRENGGYEYLLGMQVRSFTEEKVITLRNEIQTLIGKIETLTNITEKQLWINDLDEFKAKYDEWLVVMNEAEKPKGKKKTVIQVKKRVEKVITEIKPTIRKARVNK
jgi:DNA topoisomerase-2